MSVEEKLKDLIVKRYGTVSAFSKEIGMSQSTLATIMSRGINKASITSIIKICTALQISADELSNGKIVPIKEKSSDHIFISEITDMIEYMKNNPDEFSDLSVDGVKLTAVERDTFINALFLGVDFIRRSR